MLYTRSHACHCRHAQAKLAVWQSVARHEGCTWRMIVDETGQSVYIVRQCLEDLYVEGNVYNNTDDGRWYLEMEVSNINATAQW